MEQEFKIFSKFNKALDNLKDFCQIQKEIIELNDASFAYLFVKDVLEYMNNAPLNFPAFKKIVLQESTPLVLQYQFAQLLIDNNIKIDTSIIIKRLKGTKDPYYQIVAKSLKNKKAIIEEEMSDITK